MDMINYIADAASDSSSSTEGSSSDSIMLASSNPKKRDGRKKFRETRHPIYRGVRRRSSGKWVCEVREPNKKTRIWLGTFPNPQMAARAHDVAVLALRGRSACLNFADSASRLPIPASINAKDIQKAAAQAAQAFKDIGADDHVLQVEKIQAKLPETVYDVDDEVAEFGMPGQLIAEMAQGMMLPPPDQYYCDGDDVEFGADMPLWN